MLDSGNRMLALGFWRRRCALALAAVLLAVPASAQDPVDPNQDTAAAETDKPSDPTSIESDLEERDSEQPESDLEEPNSAELEEALPMDPL
jgi:opacity protein-like surface antigen